MHALAPDERTSLVMAYTHNSLVRGELVSKQAIRVSTWLRTDGAPEYLHFQNAQVLNFMGSQVRSASYAELFLPVPAVIGFHLVPPLQDPLDFDESENNRSMEPVTVLVGPFQLKGNVRISTQIGFGASITTSRLVWMSVYHSEITCPAVPQMAVLSVPMVTVRPTQVSFALPVDPAG